MDIFAPRKFIKHIGDITVEDAIKIAYMKTSYGFAGGEVSFQRPIVHANLAGGWNGEYPEIAFLVGGSPNKARGFVKINDCFEPKFTVQIYTQDQFLRVLVDSDGEASAKLISFKEGK